MSSDIQPGDLVQVTDPIYCRYGGHGADVDEGCQGHVGTVGMVVEIEPDDELTNPPGEWATLDSLPNDELVCVGCLRKLNDGEDDAELIARIKSYQPVQKELELAFLESLLLDADGLDPWIEDQLDRLWEQDHPDA